MADMNVNRIAECFLELHNLTKMKRTGWVLAGVPDPESIADHCFEAAVFATIMASFMEEKVDIGKVVRMLLFHEIGEARLADLPRRSRDYIGKAKKIAEHEASQDVLADIDADILNLVEEMEHRLTAEARLAEAAEELQIIFRAMVYAKEGRGDVSEYRRDAAAYDDMGIPIARQIADLVRSKLETYLGSKPYWETGYSKRKLRKEG